MKPEVPLVLRLAGGRTCIAFSAGRKWLHAVAMGKRIALFNLPLGGAGEPLQLKDRPYPVRRAARLYLRSPLRKTERARRVLRGLVKGGGRGSQ